MKLPTRTEQQAAEARSLSILKYKFDTLGIFRDQRENDFGIDVDFEWVAGGHVSGRYVKIQVKSSKRLRLRKDGTPSVGGIKQSTLAYWCQIALRTSVMAIAVDLKTEKVYATLDLFWQASRQIDGSETSKSITFVAADPDDVSIAALLLAAHVSQPSITEIVTAHTTVLRRLRDFLGLLTDSYHYDAGTPLELDCFRDVIDACKVLLWFSGRELFKNAADQRGWNRSQYWIEKSESDNWDGLSCYAARHPLSVLLPALVDELRRLRRRVLAGKYYWSHRNPDYLELVYEKEMPEQADREALIDWSYHYDERITVVPGSGAWFAQRSQVPATPTKKPVKPSAATTSRTPDQV
jgi:hypothetical protein